MLTLSTVKKICAYRPVYDAKGKGSTLEGRASNKTLWRRVQNDMDDNEAVILDGGLHGAAPSGGSGDEPA